MTSNNWNRVRSSLGALFLACAGTLCIATSRPAQATPPGGYTLAWSDEFSGAVGSSPNPANWTFDTGGGGWGNGELETYVTDTAHCSIISDPNATDGLALQIVATDDNGGVGTAGSYSSARINSASKVTAGYGYIEIRAKAPYGDGIWPAVWMLGSDYPDDGWPNCGEQDIFEMFCQNDGINMTSWHMNYLGNEIDWTGSYTLSNGALFDQAYHLFGMLTTQQGVTAYVDGNEFESHGNAASPGFIFNHPFYFLANLAVGGGPPGNPDATTVFPQYLDIDYIRYYTAPVGSQQYGTVSPGYGTVVDPCNDFSIVYNTSGNWIIDNSNPSYFNGDSGRLSRIYNATEWVNYKYSNISSASVSIGTNTSDNTSVTLWYSTNNGTSYTQAATTDSAITPTTAGWGMYTVATSGSLPSGVTDLEIQEAPTVNAWDHQIAQVTITSSSTPASPPPPSGLAATATSSQVALTWTSTSDATSYNIYRSTVAYAEFGAAPYATNVSTNSFTDTGLTAGMTYNYCVAAVDSAGTSPQSAQASATTTGGSVPGAPTGLTATAGSTQIALSWAAGSGATSYNVYRGTASGGESTTAVATAVTATTYTDTGLTNGTAYYYEVASLNATGTSGMSNEASATPEAGPPTAPSGLTATAGNAQVALSWGAGSGATSYNVYRGTAAGGESTTAIATGVTTTNYTNAGLTNGTAYYYKVAAINSAGTSAQSNEASATPVASVPPAPTGLTAAGTNLEVGLSWSASSSATSYNVYRGTTSGGESATPLTTGLTATAYTDTGVVNGTTYYYTVTAVDSTGTSAQSNEASATPAAGTSGPVSINCGGAASGSFVADIDFAGGSTASTSSTIGTTMVSSPIPAQAVLNTQRVGATITYTLGGFQPNSGANPTLYFADFTSTASGQREFNVTINGTEVLANFDIYANTHGQYQAIQQNFATTTNSSGQVVISLTSGAAGQPVINGIIVTGTAGSGTPGAPTGLTATPGNGQVALAWTAGSGATSYNIYRGTASGAESATAIATGITATGYTDTTVTNGTAYYYEAASVNGSGISGMSNQASGTPQVGAPAAPTGLTATGGTTQMALAWTASSGATSYNVYRGTASGGESTTAIATGVTTTSYTNTGLTAGTTYYYKVAAVNAGGTSAQSSEASAITVAGVPSGLTATAGVNQAALTWTAVAGAASYDVYRGTASGGESATPIATGVTTASYTNTGLTAGTAYYYKVTSVDAAGTSAQSAEASTTPTGTAPSAPTGLTATGGTTQVALAWTASSGATSYNVYRGTASGGESTTAIATGVTATSYTNTGLAAGTTYYYKVAALNAFGTSSQSSESSAITAAGVPSGLTATAGVNQVVLTWTAVTGAASYDVYRGTASGGESATPIATGVTTASYTNTGLTAGTAYYFKVTSVDAGGTSAQSPEVSATPTGTAPAAPTGLTATAGNAQVALSWTASSGATSYNVYRGTSSGGESGTAIATGITTASYTNTGLTNGTTYYYKVAALNSYGTSSMSSEASATPSAGGTSGSASINCGGSAASPFVADADYSGGTTGSTSTTIATPYVSNPIPPQAVLQSWRSGATFTYTMAGFTANSGHTVALYFMEPTATGTGQRAFDVAINGTSELTNFDLYAATGGQFRAIQENFTATATSSGQIVISFTSGTAGVPIVEGITVN
ncbi:MAG: fibronectin type III domain-containing protein [Capsulimonadaceae bacterium]